jgi:hypothetical protein
MQSICSNARIARDDALREAHYYLGLTFVRVGQERSGHSTADRTPLEHDEAQQQRMVLRIQDGQGGDHQNSGTKM